MQGEEYELGGWKAHSSCADRTSGGHQKHHLPSLSLSFLTCDVELPLRTSQEGCEDQICEQEREVRDIQSILASFFSLTSPPPPTPVQFHRENMPPD